MKAHLKIDMTEATRLTREGRLHEALAVLRGEVPEPNKFADDCTCGPKGASKGPSEGAGSLIDMSPPSSTGGSWTSQLTDQPTAPPTGNVSSALGRKPLHGLINGLGKLGSMPRFPAMGRSATGRGPVPLPQGAQFADRSYGNEAGQRAYKLYVPSNYTGQSTPLVIMLHGCTQSPDDFAAGTRMNELAEEHSFLVAYPAQNQSANPSKCWNWFNAGHQQRDRGEPSLIAGITRQIISEFSVDPARVFIAGLSAGGATAAVMGAAYPDLYAAIGVHSGLACGAASDMQSAFAAMRNGSSGPSARSRRHGGPVPTIVFHGDGDGTVSPINGVHVIDQAKAGVDLQTTVRRGEAPEGTMYTCTVHADEDGHAIFEHWLLHGVGHAWSGGSDAGSYTEPRGPDASREMLRFFLKNRL
ncbi:MAG: PHB depolymerase family esterase [Beijerinckiaceae bacterium]|nr:PHB depolymerase family esterase [Beijerinckiaceae bacterium]